MMGNSASSLSRSSIAPGGRRSISSSVSSNDLTGSSVELTGEIKIVANSIHLPSRPSTLVTELNTQADLCLALSKPGSYLQGCAHPRPTFNYPNTKLKITRQIAVPDIFELSIAGYHFYATFDALAASWVTQRALLAYESSQGFCSLIQLLCRLYRYNRNSKRDTPVHVRFLHLRHHSKVYQIVGGCCEHGPSINMGDLQTSWSGRRLLGDSNNV